jgi:hypothetical protein
MAETKDAGLYGMHTNACDVIERYYQAFDAHGTDWQNMVTDDVVFEGPVQHARANRRSST